MLGEGGKARWTASAIVPMEYGLRGCRLEDNVGGQGTGTDDGPRAGTLVGPVVGPSVRGIAVAGRRRRRTHRRLEL